MGFLWGFKRMSMGFPLDSYGIPVVFLWYFYGISLGCPWYFYGITMGFRKGCRWYFYGIPIGFEQDTSGISIGFLWNFYDISMGLLWDFHDRRKFRSQTSGNMDRWKAEMGRVREKRRVEERRSEKRKSQKKEDPGARKGREVAKHYVFPMVGGSGGSKSRLATAAGAEPSGQMRDEKLHAVVARSTFRSQNVQNTTCSRHFWRFRCAFAWQAQGIVDLVESEQNVGVL